MFAVIFEVEPKKERWDEYLGIAKALRPKLEAVPGFVFNERFRSRRKEGRLLSLSIWRDEKALIRWRTEAAHHRAQERGRSEVFADYHLRVGEIVADSEPPPGVALDRLRFDETEAGAAKAVTITETTAPGAELAVDAGSEGLVDQELYESITTEGKRLLLVSWRDAESAARWRPSPGGKFRHRQVRIIRDYGLFDRREAPQFYPEVRRG
jgi:heme-degrading monooxygenase HmoA